MPARAALTPDRPAGRPPPRARALASVHLVGCPRPGIARAVSVRAGGRSGAMRPLRRGLSSKGTRHDESVSGRGTRDMAGGGDTRDGGGADDDGFGGGGGGDGGGDSGGGGGGGGGRTDGCAPGAACIPLSAHSGVIPTSCARRAPRSFKVSTSRNGRTSRHVSPLPTARHASTSNGMAAGAIHPCRAADVRAITAGM